MTASRPYEFSEKARRMRRHLESKKQQARTLQDEIYGLEMELFKREWAEMDQADEAGKAK